MQDLPTVMGEVLVELRCGTNDTAPRRRASLTASAVSVHTSPTHKEHHAYHTTVSRRAAAVALAGALAFGVSACSDDDGTDAGTEVSEGDVVDDTASEMSTDMSSEVTEMESDMSSEVTEMESEG